MSPLSPSFYLIIQFLKWVFMSAFAFHRLCLKFMYCLQVKLLDFIPKLFLKSLSSPTQSFRILCSSCVPGICVLFFILKKEMYFMCACVDVHHIYARCSWKPEEGIRSSGIRVIDDGASMWVLWSAQVLQKNSQCP